MAAWTDPPSTSLEHAGDKTHAAYSACSLINTRQVDLRDELNSRRYVWIVVAAMNIERINSILVHTLFPSKASV